VNTMNAELDSVDAHLEVLALSAPVLGLTGRP
jgi:hypothetical protein